MYKYGIMWELWQSDKMQVVWCDHCSLDCIFKGTCAKL